MTKGLLNSKRFWAGLIGLITISSLIFTGERTFTQQIPLIIADAFALIQLIIGTKSTATIKGIL